MKIISWIVQGIKKKQALQEILFLKRLHNPNIMFILETLASSTNLSSILPQIGFDHFDFVDPVNHSGPIAVLWNNGIIHASILRKEQRAIPVLLHDTSNNQNVMVNGLYAPAQSRDKDSFWNHLFQFNSVVDLPWCLIGDFNELASPGEKRGGLQYPLSKYERLKNFTSYIRASTVPYKGNLFTWKKKVHMQLIYEGLDRAIMRNDWMNLYP